MKTFLQTLVFLLIPMLGIGQQTINDSITHDDLNRDFILYVPEIYNPDVATPLVLNFHGYTSSAFEQMWYGDFRPIADTVGFLVVHPMGTVDSFGNTHWNVGWGTSTVDDVGFTEALIDSLALEYNIDMERVYSTGMSNGGFMSYTLACELSHRIAAIASVTGTMNINQADECDAEHPMPVMEIHGTADGTVPYEGAVWIESTADVLSYWADFNNCDTTPLITELPDIDPEDGSTVEHQLFAHGENGVNVEHFKIINGGHTWPGNFIGGNGTNYDIDASAEVWNFFSRYDINGLITPTDVVANHLNKLTIKVYPNPASDFVVIEMETSTHLEYEFYNTLGSRLASGTLSSRKTMLDLIGKPAGIYVLKLGAQTFKVLKTD